MKMIKVKSSNIRTIGYSANLFQLAVEFKATDRSKAKVFAYEDVSPAEHEALMNAGSIGKHFSSYIKVVKEFHEIDCDVIDGILHARDLILDKVEQATSPWISVDDAMPEHDGQTSEIVDIWSGKHRFTDHFYSLEDKTWYDEEYGTAMNDVTHWMPLPKPPTI